MGLPGFKRYYYATLITRIIDWNCHEANKDWVNLERSYTELPLRSLHWIIKSYYPKQLLLHPLIAGTLEAFHKISKQHNLARTPGPLTPISNNPEFISGRNTNVILNTSKGTSL